MDDGKLVPKARAPEIEKAGETTLDASLPAKDRLTSRLASGLADRLVQKGTGPLPLLVVFAAGRLWWRDARDWYDGRARR